MVDVAVEKYNEMKEDNQLFSWAESAEFAERAVQANLREQTAEAKRLGIKEGMEEGKKTSLKLLLQRKYGVEDTWVDTLTAQQVEDALICILDCHTYDALKAQLSDKNV